MTLNELAYQIIGIAMRVDERIVVEIKAARGIGLHDVKQVLTYLKLLDLRLGLIFNFSAPSMRKGIKRVVNGF